jgi:transposase
MSKKLHPVHFTEEDRALLQQQIFTGVHSARSITRAQVLLAADRQRSDPWIADHHEVSHATVYKTRRRYCTEGLQAVLTEKPRPGAPKKLDGRGEARFTAMACSDPPLGRQRWTVRRLADKLVELELVESISPATVGTLLKKTNSPPGKSANGASARSAACFCCSWKICSTCLSGRMIRGGLSSVSMNAPANYSGIPWDPCR